MTCVTNPLGHRTRYEWDPLNQLTKVLDPLNGATQVTYDPNGNLTGVRDARGNLTQYAPDSIDRVLTRTDALQHASSVLLYDGHGNPRQVRDRKGQVTQTTYDPLNHPKVVTWADASTTTLTWDAGNRLAQLVDSISGTITRSRDDLDRLQYEQTPQGRIDYTYDDAGRRQTMTVLGQPSVVYNWGQRRPPPEPDAGRGRGAPGLRRRQPPHPRCGGRLRLISTLQDPAVVRTILAHHHRSAAAAPPGPAPSAPAASA